MKQGAVVVEQKKFGRIVYAILLLASVFVLGWFAGNGAVRPQIEVTVVEPSAASPQLSDAGKLQTAEKTAKSEGPLDLNLCEQSDLENLPGIGPELAARIIAYRESIGTFVTKEQVMDVEGIGEKRYADMEQLITVGGTP